MELTILVSVAVGCVVGRLITLFFKDNANMLRNILCGAVGGIMGGLCVKIVSLEVYSWFFEILVALVGAVVFVWVIKASDKKRR